MIKNTYRSYKRMTLNITVTFLCILVSVIIMFFQNYNGYELLFTQPILYIFVFTLVFSKIIIRDKTRLFFYVLAGISGIRYVLLPLLIVLSGYYGGRSIIEPNSATFFKAILLMNYELVVIGFFIKHMELRREKTSINYLNSDAVQQFDMRGNNFGYFLFGLITIISIIVVPSVLLSINFITPNSLLHSIEFNFIQNLIIYFIIVLKQLIFVLVVKKMYRLYNKKKKNFYVFLSFIFALTNTFIYFGTNRSDIVISAIVSFLLLYKLFGKVTKKYFIFGGIFLIILIIMVTGARSHMSISGGESRLVDITDTFQVYTGGVYNVAIALETKDYFPEANDLSVLFFDIFRPMIGVNVLVKDLPFEYSNIFFNRRMWLNVDRRSQILPMIGQGNLFFGFLLAPLLSMIFIRLFYYFEKIILKTKNIEVYYFFTLVIVRLGFFMGQNTMNLINDMSMNLVLFLFVFLFNKSINNVLSK